MSVNLQTTGVHHVALRVSDLPRAKRFYTETLGFPVGYYVRRKACGASGGGARAV
ncbi:MAG: VOC family protein [Gemmatimonadaceae bacterium]|nr:VOC family protein [Gemmatimonadaceae bacterium]